MISIQLFSSNSKIIYEGYKMQENNRTNRVLQDLKDEDNKRNKTKKETD